MTDTNSIIRMEHLRSLLSYNPNTGEIVWLCPVRYGINPGDRAGYYTATGYREIRVSGRGYREHRIAWALHHGEWPKDQIDHINGDKADNRIANLRVVPQSINCRNKRLRSDNTSGHPGISWLKKIKRWQVSAPDGCGRNIYVGVFDDLDSAIAARRTATEAMGYGPRHGSVAA